MPALIELGYVERRAARWEGAKEGEMGLFLTPAGSDLLNVLGRGDFGERWNEKPAAAWAGRVWMSMES
jgi:hypothetical protein